MAGGDIIIDILLRVFSLGQVSPRPWEDVVRGGHIRACEGYKSHSHIIVVVESTAVVAVGAGDNFKMEMGSSYCAYIY